MAEKKEETNNMNIYKKIQKVKLELSKRELKKSGLNSFSNFKYYELGDFLPSIIELCNKYGLFTHVTFEDEITKDNEGKSTKLGEKAILTIYDTDYKKTPETSTTYPMCISYTCDVKDLNLKGANSIQNYGGIQTYLRRYLYMNAFDIVEADIFDMGKKSFNDLIETCKKSFKETDEVTKKEAGALMKKLGYNSFKNLSQSEDKKGLISLAHILKVEVPEELEKE